MKAVAERKLGAGNAGYHCPLQGGWPSILVVPEEGNRGWRPRSRPGFLEVPPGRAWQPNAAAFSQL